MVGLLASAKDAFVTVDGGRGFLVECQRGPLVITAAHCLRGADGEVWLPPAHPASYTEERTYANLLGPLGQPPQVWAECLFVDPIADVAVLGAADCQELPDESDAYDSLVDGRPTLRIGTVQDACAGGPLTLDGQWEQCTVAFSGSAHRYLLITNTTATSYAPGTSGSPIVADDGRAALGIVSGGRNLNPALAGSLPGWLLSQIT